MPKSNQARHGSVTTLILVLLLLAAGVFLWFARIMDVQAPTPMGPVSSEPFLEISSTQVVATTVSYTQADQDELASFLIAQELAALAASHPMLQVGDVADLRQANGVVGRGEILSMDTQYLVQRQGSLTNQLTITSLDAWVRLRADQALREEWVRYRAYALARSELAGLGSNPPLVSTNTAALSAGDPQALNEQGMRYVTGRDVPADPGRGFFLIYQAAWEGWPAAQHNLGILYLRGLAVEPNLEEGLRWISLAARQGWKPAQTFLDEKKVAWDRAQNLATECENRIQVAQADARARLASTKTATVSTASQVLGRPLRPDGHSAADFKLRYFWWRDEAEPAFNVTYGPQGQRHLHLPRP